MKFQISPNSNLAWNPLQQQYDEKHTSKKQLSRAFLTKFFFKSIWGVMHWMATSDNQKYSNFDNIPCI